MPSIQTAYNFIVEKCNASNVGYSMNLRKGQYSGGIQYYDCSSLISAGLTAGGFYRNNPWFNTDGEMSQLKRVGFVQHPVTDPWKPGDILLRLRGFHGHTYGHTEMVYKGRVTMGAHSASYSLPKQVSINNYDSKPSDWQYLFRYENGATPSDPDTNMSLYVFSAIAGNFWTESGCNPGIHGNLSPSSPYYGLGMWSQDRLQNLLSFLSTHGFRPDSGDGQSQFVLVEKFWKKVDQFPEFPTWESFMNSKSTDIDRLTLAFLYCWEIAPGQAEQTRKDRAHRVYSYIQEHYNDDVHWTSGNYYITEQQTLDNIVLLYRMLCTGNPGSLPEGLSNTWIYGNARELYRRIYIKR